MGLYNDLLLIRTLYLLPFARYSASKISVSDLDLSGSPKVEYFIFFGKPIWDFIMMPSVDTNSLSRTVCEIFRNLRFRFVTLTFHGHQKINISTFLGSRYGTL